MVDQSRVQWRNRAHFFGVAAQMMRRVLVDHARSQGAGKRGGGVERTQIAEGLVAPVERGSELVAIDDALAALEQIAPAKAKVVELRFFGGLSIEETARRPPASAPPPLIATGAWPRRGFNAELQKERGT